MMGLLTGCLNETKNGIAIGVVKLKYFIQLVKLEVDHIVVVNNLIRG